jgi:hypothetical protein
LFISLLTAAEMRRPLAIWEIQLTQIATATGDENLVGDGAAHTGDSSSGETSTPLSGYCPAP